MRCFQIEELSTPKIIVNRNVKDILINCKNVTQCHGEKWYYDSGESQQSLTATYTYFKKAVSRGEAVFVKYKLTYR